MEMSVAIQKKKKKRSVPVMRLSIDTLILLARLGDEEARLTAMFLGQNKCAEAWSLNKGKSIGAGWPGVSRWT